MARGRDKPGPSLPGASLNSTLAGLSLTRCMPVQMLGRPRYPRRRDTDAPPATAFAGMRSVRACRTDLRAGLCERSVHDQGFRKKPLQGSKLRRRIDCPRLRHGDMKSGLRLGRGAPQAGGCASTTLRLAGRQTVKRAEDMMTMRSLRSGITAVGVAFFKGIPQCAAADRGTALAGIAASRSQSPGMR